MFSNKRVKFCSFLTMKNLKPDDSSQRYMQGTFVWLVRVRSNGAMCVIYVAGLTCFPMERPLVC